MIAGLVFDFDGTLVDSNEIKRRAFHEVAAAAGATEEIVAEVLATTSGDRLRVFREIVARLHARQPLPGGRTPDEWVGALVENYSALCERRIAACAAVPGATQALRELEAAGFPLYVNSATPTAPLVRLLSLRGLGGFFRGAYGSPASKMENLRAISRHAGLPFSRLLMVGDGEDDRRAAREAGCAFAGVVLGERRFHGAADLVLTDLAALPAFVAHGAPL